MKQVTGLGEGSSALAVKDSLELSALASWILGFGLIVFAGASDGAFGVSLFGQIGIFAWLLLALGLLLGLFPIDRPGPDGWTAIGLWTGLAAWAALGLLWTESPDKTWLEIARLGTYGGVFALALLSRGRNHLPAQLGSVAAGITVVAGLALVSRFQPDLFPSAADVGQTLTSEAARLSFPLGYWNGLAALVAIGLALLVELAVSSKRLVFRAAATAAIPISILTIYFTFSRGGILAAALATVVYFLLSRDRLYRLIPAGIGLLGGIILVLFARSQHAIRDGLSNQTAASQGDTMLLLTIGICLLTGVAGFLVLGRSRIWQVPGRLHLGRRQAWISFAVIATLVLVVFIAVSTPGRIANGWESFKSSDPPANGSARLEAANGNGRYQYWSSAVKQWEESPVAGQGAGTYEFWWAETGDRAGFIRDTHSLYFQTLGESGLIGLALLLGLFGLILAVGCRRSLFRVLNRRDPAAGWMAAATAGCVAFMTSAALDWSWQLPAVVFPFLLLSATVLARSSTDEAGLPIASRAGLVVIPLVVSVLIAIPLFSTIALEQSQEKARAGDLAAALDNARSAHSISPSTAAPLVQEAGLLEALGEPGLAIDAARDATEAEPVNWRNWLILALIEARNGDVTLALEHYQEAKRLNPRSQIFAPRGAD